MLCIQMGMRNYMPPTRRARAELFEMMIQAEDATLAKRSSKKSGRLLSAIRDMKSALSRRGL